MTIQPLLLPATALLALAAQVLAHGNVLLINELDADQGASDTAEFIELHYPGGSLALDDYFVVLYDGATGTEYRSFDLDTQDVPADGYFVIGPTGGAAVDFSTGFPGTNGLQDGADAVAIWFDPSGALTTGSFAGTAVASPPAGAKLVDALVYDTASGAADAVLIAALTPGHVQVDENANAAAATESSARLVDLSPFITEAYEAQSPTPGASNGGVTGVWTDLGFALAGVSGLPVLTPTGTLVVNSPGMVSLTNAAPNAFSVLFISATHFDAPFKGGTLVPGPRWSPIYLVTDASGQIHLPWAAWPAGIPVDDDFYIQFWIVDAAGVQGVSSSNAYRAVQP
jgi:hypothetical protein